MDHMKLEKIVYRYEDGTVALDSVDLVIRPGERVALVGPNGAGKSTLLHIMAALYLPTSGSMSIVGEVVAKKTAEAARRNVGLLFQDPDDQIFMPRVWDDVAFGPINMGLKEDEVKDRVKGAMVLAGIESYADRVPHHLSFGEKKRVAIAGVLAMSPPILLMDEPTANLDPHGRRALVNVLQSLDKTMVIATHDLSVAFELTKRVVVLKRKVLYDGDFRGLMARPDILSEANLELPSLVRLLEGWAQRTGRKFEMPLNVEEAIDLLCRVSP